MSRGATAAGFIAFFLIGAVQAFYGPTQFAFQTRFQIDAATVSLMVSCHFLGSLTGILMVSSLEQRLGWRTLLVAGTLLLMLGCVGIVLAPIWLLVLLATFVLGLGFGLLDLSFNTIFSSGFGDQSVAMTNILNASFGVGAIAGPFIVSFFTNNSSTPFLLMAVLTIVLLPFVIQIKAAKLEVATAKLQFSGLLGLFMLMFFVYVGVEVSAANLEPRHLKEALGFSPESAAQWNGLYWAGLTAARIIIAPLTVRFRLQPPQIVIGGALVAVMGLALTFFAPLAPYAYIVAGFGFGPIFPTGFVWLTQAIPSSVAAASIVVAAANLGAVVFPPIASRIAVDAAWIPLVLLVLGVGLLLLTVLLMRRARV